jgi:antitoxin component YwqK of YwqJK toxin-antitoxin module
LKSETHYKDGKIIGLATKWHKNVVKSGEQQWKDNHLWLDTGWDEDGNMVNQYDHEGDPRA